MVSEGARPWGRGRSGDCDEQPGVPGTPGRCPEADFIRHLGIVSPASSYVTRRP